MAWLHWLEAKLPNTLKFFSSSKKPKHLSSQLACLLIGGPGYGSRRRPFCGLAKWSRSGSECIHKEEAQLHQPLGHMIPTKHTAQAEYHLIQTAVPRQEVLQELGPLLQLLILEALDDCPLQKVKHLTKPERMNLQKRDSSAGDEEERPKQVIIAPRDALVE
ncbi:hypothetical protein EYF80_001767 [Liparis tanakae]|uniref:Uncharacterized protein n=1 Tax=Liparis tanakae TaxID=230148 RepID=A0A4Z2JDH3_9TELE|nr:hypothetical protein EYF80_001767 [Liparis tanakae]